MTSSTDGEETEPALLVDSLGRRLRPLAVGGLVLLLLGFAELGVVARSLGESQRQARELVKVAERLEREQEFALEEYAPVVMNGQDVNLGTFVVNPDGPAKSRFFRVQVVMTVSDVERFESSALGKVRAKEIIGTTLAAQTVDEMGVPGAADAMRARLERLIKRSFLDGLVTDVHFAEFVVQ